MFNYSKKKKIVFVETRLWDNKKKTNNVCFPVKQKKEYRERKSDDVEQLEWHYCLWDFNFL